VSLRQGVDINHKGKIHRTRPCRATLLGDDVPVPPRDPPIRYRAQIPTSWISLALSEGKNRQVRPLSAAPGFCKH
jgi:23S rRNA pseudouridine2457 synthase